MHCWRKSYLVLDIICISNAERVSTTKSTIKEAIGESPRARDFFIRSLPNLETRGAKVYCFLSGSRRWGLLVGSIVSGKENVSMYVSIMYKLCATVLFPSFIQRHIHRFKPDNLLRWAYPGTRLVEWCFVFICNDCVLCYCVIDGTEVARWWMNNGKVNSQSEQCECRIEKCD